MPRIPYERRKLPARRLIIYLILLALLVLLLLKWDRIIQSTLFF